MRRRVALASSLAVALWLSAGTASAVVCNGRPTDAAGYSGYAYGAAEAKSFDGTKVRVHYTTTGPHAPVQTSTRTDLVPDTVALAASVGDNALGQYATWGFKVEPSDIMCPSNGGDEKLDIYLVDFAGADGTTVPEACDGRVCASFVLVEATFVGRGYKTVDAGFRTVVAHELFHTVQNGYDHELDRFWAEGTAQWAMKTVYPDLDDFENQLPDFFKENTRSLDTQPAGVTAGFLYGSAVWPLFLTLHHGKDTVRSVFEKEVDGTKTIAAVDLALAAVGSSVADDMPLFGAWNAATRTLAGTGGYPDAAAYPGVATLPLLDGATAITSGLPYFVYRGTLDALSQVSLDTDATRNAGVLVPVEGGKPALDKAQKLPATAMGDVLVVVAGTTVKKTDAPFTLHIGPPDAMGEADAGPTSGATGSDSSSGGCAASGVTVPRSVAGSGGPSVLGAFLFVLACAMRRRTRS